MYECSAETKQCVCDLAEQSWALKAELCMNAVLRLNSVCVCDLAEQSWALKAEL